MLSKLPKWFLDRPDSLEILNEVLEYQKKDCFSIDVLYTNLVDTLRDNYVALIKSCYDDFYFLGFHSIKEMKDYMADYLEEDRSATPQDLVVDHLEWLYSTKKKSYVWLENVKLSVTFDLAECTESDTLKCVL